MKQKKTKYSLPQAASKKIREDSITFGKHPGGKLRERGAKELTTEELLAILISTGYKGKAAVEVAKEILSNYGSLEALANIPLSELLRIKGLGDVKIIRIAAALELGKRTAEEILKKRTNPLSS